MSDNRTPHQRGTDDVWAATYGAAYARLRLDFEGKPSSDDLRAMAIEADKHAHTAVDLSLQVLGKWKR